MKERQLDSIASCIALISDFSNTPFPIPIASSGEDGEATLFIETEKFYADLEILGTSVEYYLKEKRQGGSEFFDIESIEDGFIPRNLLVALYTCAYRSEKSAT